MRSIEMPNCHLKEGTFADDPTSATINRLENTLRSEPSRKDKPHYNQRSD